METYAQFDAGVERAARAAIYRHCQSPPPGQCEHCWRRALDGEDLCRGCLTVFEEAS